MGAPADETYANSLGCRMPTAPPRPDQDAGRRYHHGRCGQWARDPACAGRLQRVRGRSEDRRGATGQCHESVHIWSRAWTHDSGRARTEQRKPIAQYDVVVQPSHYGAGEAEATISRVLPGAAVHVDTLQNGLSVAGKREDARRR